MTRILAIIFSAVIATGCARQVDDSSVADLALTNVSVVDVVNGRVDAGQTVQIRGDRIVAVGPAATTVLPKSVRRVDGSGTYVIPGLFDMHAHSQLICKGDDCAICRGSQCHAPLGRYVAAGVLGIRDLGAPLDSIAAIAKDEAIVRPAIWFAGPILDGFRGSAAERDRVIVESEDQARSAVSTLSKGGASVIKVHDWLTRSSYLSIVQSARDQHLPVVGHVPVAVTMDDAITAGQRSVEHLGGWGMSVLRACGRGDARLDQERQRRASEKIKDSFYELAGSSAYLTPLLDTFDPSACEALARRMAAAKMFQDPTLGLWQVIAQSAGPADIAARRRLFDRHREIVQIMYKAGVPILAGTDNVNTIDDELELLVSAGLPPMAAIQSATINAADSLGVKDSYGVVAAGRVANLVLIDANPLTDIRALRQVRFVVLRGQVFDRTALANLAK